VVEVGLNGVLGSVSSKVLLDICDEVEDVPGSIVIGTGLLNGGNAGVGQCFGVTILRDELRERMLRGRLGAELVLGDDDGREACLCDALRNSDVRDELSLRVYGGGDETSLLLGENNRLRTRVKNAGEVSWLEVILFEMVASDLSSRDVQR
jgi:hypothetical protein